MSVEKKLGLINENLDRVSSEEPLFINKTVTFDGATEGGIGDISEPLGATSDLYTVAGNVAVKIWGFCTTLMEDGSTGTVEVGIVGNTAGLIAQTVGNTIDAGDSWLDASPATVPAMPTAYKILAGGTDIILTCATDDINSGVIEFTVGWYALSSNGNVVAA